jgi:protein SCO1/2
VLSAIGCSSQRIHEVDFAGRIVPDAPFTIDPTPLAETRTGTEISLASDLDHRLTLLFFGYTHCPDLCPMVLSSIASALTRLDAADREQVQVVFVTTDPARDSADRISAYLAHFDPTFIGLRTSIVDVARVAKSVGVFVATGGSLPSGGYDPGAHGTLTIAIDRNGHAPVYWPMETSAAHYAADISFMLGGGGPDLRVPTLEGDA